MQFSTIHRGEIPFFNSHQVAFCYTPEKYASFINKPFSLANFKGQIQEKSLSFTLEQRKQLVAVLTEQNKDASSKTNEHIQSLLLENTFTVTTGHQLVNFTGPFYFILKILHAIKLAEKLSATYPDKNFVPVYWMATEDHDYEEIKAVHLFSQTINWETEQSGPVGRFNAESYSVVIEQIKALFNNHPDSEIQGLLDIEPKENYTSYFYLLVQKLFKAYGLVIIDGDSSALKAMFAPIMKQEVQNQTAYSIVLETNEELEKIGAKIQVNPREINLFYIGENLRERLILNNGKIDIPQKGTFSIEEISADILAHPENYSPNVVLRPVYQEVILPNLCYIGGGGEINYWLQLKDMFAAFNIPFPILQTRISALYIDKNTQKKLSQMEMRWQELLPENSVIHRNFIEKNPENQLDFSQLDTLTTNLCASITEVVLATDSNMNKLAEAENTKLQKQIEQIKEKLFKMNKSKHEAALKSIDQMREKLFPQNGLQERKWNLFHFLPNGNYSEFLAEIKDAIDIENQDLLIIEEGI